MIPYFKLFQFLQKHPRANYSQIAENLGISDKTAKSYVDYLKENGYIIGTRATFIPEVLGLETALYIIKERKIENIVLLEKLADFHDYTCFRNRILGSIQGLVMQFYIPEEAIKYLDELFSQLKELKVIEDFSRLKADKFRTDTKPEFEQYDNVLGEWIWNLHSWEQKYEKTSSKKPEETQNQELTKRLQILDLQLLRELTIDANITNKELAEKYNATAVQVSRRLAFLSDQLIEYVLLYERSKIQPVDLVFYVGKCSTDRRNKLFNLVKNYPIPFDSSLRLLQGGFIWRMNIPPTYNSQFGEFLWKICDQLDFYRMNHTKSRLYWFYGDPFDMSTKKWDTTRKKVYDEPLTWIKKQLKK